MFTRRKSLFKRKSFYITVFAVLGVGFLLFSLISSPDEAEAENISTNVKQPVAENIVDSNNFSEDSEQKNSEPKIDNIVQENQSGEYYLVKEAGGVIKIYKYDEEGNESLLRTTDILFSLLGASDQELFSDGVIVNTEDELLELLQDFES